MNTMQQEFDAVVEHLFKQGRPALNAENHCAYRAPQADGTMLMCAVGVRIPDAAYDPVMDEKNLNAYALTVDFGSVLPKELTQYREMFIRLQSIHDSRGNLNEDGMFDVTRIKSSLIGVAQQYGLAVKAPLV